MSAGLGLQLMFGEHIEVLKPSGRNPGSQLYSICDPTAALTNLTELFAGGMGWGLHSQLNGMHQIKYDTQRGVVVSLFIAYI